MTLLERGCLRWFSSFSLAELIGKTIEECTRYVDQPPVKAAIHGRVLVWRAQLQTSADYRADVGLWLPDPTGQC